MSHCVRTVSLGALLLSTCLSAAAPGCGESPTAAEPTGSVQAFLTQAERMVRYGKIRDAAATRGIDHTAYLLAGIAYSETGLAHCWSEATWACQGPNSVDCGGGPVIAGAGDGPCSLQQGGLGMFQFDAGTFADTLATYGDDVLTIAGNTSHAIDYVLNMVQKSTYTPQMSSAADALDWINNFDYNNATHKDIWVKTVTHYYNGCLPSYSCWSQRYAHYMDGLDTVVGETGLPFWVVNLCTPTTEVCNGQDDDCDEKVDEDEVCEREALLRGQSWVAPARTTDIDGDGKADVCGRGSAGVWCHLSKGTSFADKGAVLELEDSSGWDDPTNYGTIRMGDIDGDGRADLCARANAAVDCWKSDGKSLSTAVQGPGWSDDSGWGGFQFHSTMRLLDIDADGKDDLCARAAKGIVCHKSTGSAFGAQIDGPAWSDSAGLDSAKYYGTLRTGDVDGDRRVDLCMRVQSGMECWLSDGKGFPTKVTGPAWSDDSGWGGFPYWSTIRLADVNGDGKADLCARAAAGLRCHFSDGKAFGDAVEVAPLSDQSGWNDPSNFLSLRVGDIDGDGAKDLCLRANAAVLCYRWDGKAFAKIDGPAWSDADKWNEPQYFHTMQLGDFDGDGMDDLCARHVDGWRCHPSTGSGFGAAVSLAEFTDSGGWGAEKYFSTIQFGGPACVVKPETCNGVDDDCDGQIDEDGCPSGSGGAAGSSGSGGAAGKAGASGKPGFGTTPDDDSGCGCRSAGRTPPSWPALFGLALAALALSKRRH